MEKIRDRGSKMKTELTADTERGREIITGHRD